jgi:hypothetical protein
MPKPPKHPKFEFEDKVSDLDILEDIKRAVVALHSGKVHIIPSTMVAAGTAVLWVSSGDFMKIKRGLSGE